MYVSVCVFQGVFKGMRASNEHRYGSVPTQTLEPQASPAKYAIKNFTLEHANYGARQLAAAATGLSVCIAMAISVHIFIATFLHVFVFRWILRNVRVANID